MALRFNCSDSFEQYCCKTCGLCFNERLLHLFHNCRNENKGEVMFDKRLCYKCTTSSYSTLWIFSHQISHGEMENKIKCDTKDIFSKTDKKFYCDQCVFTTNRKHTQSRNVKTKHTCVDKEGCYKCKRKTQKSQYHKKSKHFFGEKRYQCDQCDYQSHLDWMLRSHFLRRHTPENLIKWHNCNICSYRAKVKNCLNRHIKFMHTPSDQLKWYKCNICDFKTKKRFSLKNHLKRRHLIKKLPQKFKCNDFVYESRTKQMIAKDTPDRSTNVCSFVTTNLDNLKRHLKNKHFTEKVFRNYKCNECTYIARTKSNLQDHLLAKHTPDHLVHWYNCGICSFKTKRHRGLKKHLEVQHLMKKQSQKYQCNECVYQTHSQYELKRHILVKHTPDHLINWYNCSLCVFKTKTRRYLKKHITAVHGLEDEPN